MRLLRIYINPKWPPIILKSYCMMTSSNGNVFRVTGPLCGNSPVTGEFPSQRPVTRSFDVSFDLQLNKRLSKQSWGWWLETASGSLWCHWENEWWHRLLTHKRSHLDSVTKCQQTDQYCCILCRLSYYDCQTGSTLWNWREFSHMP